METELKEFIEKLADLVPSIESVKHLSHEGLHDTVEQATEVIEDVSLFVMTYISRKSWIRLIYSIFDTAPQERIEKLNARFRRLRQEFDTRVGVQTLTTVTAEAIRSQLQPVGLAGYDSVRACMAGTRLSLIDDITSWARNPCSDQTFAWLYGLAGLGKSSVATSVCQQLDEHGTLGASFFCKRDSPELRDPCRALATIAYSLSVRWEAYGVALMKALQDEAELHTRQIRQRYEVMLGRPLRILAETQRPKDAMVIVVDALDECEREESRKQLLGCLQDMSQIAPWLKVLVTSRPDSDIQAYFGQDKTNWYSSYNLLKYPADADILLYVRKQLEQLEHHDGWPKEAIDELSSRSNGLFIWARTSCKYITDGYEPVDRLTQILDGTRIWDYDSDSGPKSVVHLDMLYATAIRTGAVDSSRDNIAAIRRFLGMVAATSTRTPLSLSNMCALLKGRIRHSTLERMVHNLLSVIYIDQEVGHAIRVVHPSFMDYITDRTRSKELCVDLDEQNMILAECCMQTMTAELQLNLCDLETSHLLNKDVANLDVRVEDRIRPHLKYSCMYWTSHLTEAKKGGLDRVVQKFLFSTKLLYWIEALSLLGKLDVAPASMIDLYDHSVASEDCQEYARDVYRFLLSCYDAICVSTPHLYLSALALTPERSVFAQHMRPEFPNMFQITQGAERDWTPCIRTIFVGSEVNSVAWSALSRKLATGSDDGAVRVWDAETGASVLEPIQAHSERVWSVAFSPDGRLIVSGSTDGTVRVWDTETGTEALDPLEGHSASVHCVTFSPSGAFIASASDDGSMRVWDTSTGETLHILNGHEKYVWSVTFSADGRRLASGSKDRTVRLWDVGTGAMALEPLTGHTAGVNSVAFSHGGHRIVSGSDDCTIRVWDANAGSTLRVIPGHSSCVPSLAFLLDDRRVVSGSWDGTVRTWDVDTGAQLSLFLGHSADVWSVGCSPDGRRIVSGSDDKTVRIWDAEVEDTAARVPQGHSGWVECVAFSPDGCRIASCSDDATVRIWDAATGAAAVDPIRGHSGRIYSIAYSPDGRRIVSGSGDQTVRVWDAETGAAVSEPLQGHSESVRCVAFSHDGTLIASGSYDTTICLWGTSTMTRLYEPLQGHSECVSSVAFSPDGCHLVSGSGDSTVRLWDTSNGMSVLEPLQGHRSKVNCVAYSPDGQRIASCSDDYTIRIWDAKTGVPLLEPIQGHPQGVDSVVFSSDGQHILSSSYDRTLRIWNAKTGRLLREPLKGHDDGVFSVVFSPNGRYIASGSLDRSVRVWDVDGCVDSDTTTQRHLPGTDILTLAGSTDAQPVSTSSLLARRMRSDGWVTTPDGGLYVWLPPDLRRVDDSVICISMSPPRARVVMDFSRFVHGKEWTSVAGGEVGL
ncbi:hypothetical protein RhiJN_21362 [Ceratobasidium sp. AG-Ba]|nr:hypothetical protein RhiJN_21362 [Ceratobasidium sp. AG-Ba]